MNTKEKNIDWIKTFSYFCFAIVLGLMVYYTKSRYDCHKLTSCSPSDYSYIIRYARLILMIPVAIVAVSLFLGDKKKK